MKTIYKVKVTIKMGEVESTRYSVIEIVENGIKDGEEIEILIDSFADYIKLRSDKGNHPPGIN